MGPTPTYGKTFGDDRAAREEMNPLLGYSDRINASIDEKIAAMYAEGVQLYASEGGGPVNPLAVNVEGLKWDQRKVLDDGTEVWHSSNPAETRLKVEKASASGGDWPSIPGYTQGDISTYQLVDGAYSHYLPTFKKEDVGFVSLAKNFVGGIGDVAYGLTVGTALNATDLLGAMGSIGWNEFGGRSAYNAITNSNAPNWYANMHGPTVDAYVNGTSQTELVLANIPIVNIGVMSYHATTAGMHGDWNGLARQSGGVAGGVAVGAGVKRYGNYNVRSPVYMDIQPGQLNSGIPIAIRNPLTTNFGAHLRKMKGAPPAGMKDPHAHHILFKDGLGPAQKALVQEGQALLRQYDIDPILGGENLVWDPNRVAGQHHIDALRNVVDKLNAVHKSGGDRADMVDMLQRLGELAAERK